MWDYFNLLDCKKVSYVFYVSGGLSPVILSYFIAKTALAGLDTITNFVFFIVIPHLSNILLEHLLIQNEKIKSTCIFKLYQPLLI